MGNGIQIVTELNFFLLEAFPVVNVIFGIFRHPCHDGNCFHRVFPRRRFARKHDRRGAVINRIGHVGNLRSGGADIGDHGFEHLRCNDHAASEQPAFGNDFLLDGRHLHIVDLHSQIAPSYHDTARHFADIFYILYTGTILDLGNDTDVLTVVLVQKLPHLSHVVSCGNKGGSHKINAVFNAEQKVGFILFAQEISLHQLTRKIHALVVGNDTSRLHGADHILLLNLLHNADHQPVVHQNLVARFHRMRQVLITDGNLLLIAFHLSGGEDKGISLLQFNLVIRKRTDSIFRPLGIQHDGNRYPHALPEFLDRDDLFLMFFVCTVRKIESGDIHPRLYHLLQNFFILRGGTNGTNDLCFSHRGFLSFIMK